MRSMHTNPTSVPDRDSLPLKKRDQRQDMSSPPPQQHHHSQHQYQDQHQHPCDVATFKVPFPHRSHSEVRLKHSAPLQPMPRRTPALHQPWVQNSTGSRPHFSSMFREHPGLLTWRETGPAVQLGWDFHSPQHQAGFSVAPYALYSAHPQEPSGLSQGMVTSYSWERPKMLRDESSSMNGQHGSRNRGPYARKQERKAVGASQPSPSSHIPPTKGLKPQHDTPLVRQSGRSCARGERLRSTMSSVRDYIPAVSSEKDSISSSSSSSLPNPLPWLLPHFLAGSLIELRDGQLRKVEHLQTEDFLLGSLALPDLRLSCCTVQSIAAAPASSSVSRLLVLLHDQQSQELVDVYVEYPFFVQGCGWSSCSPQRTARLCGLQCRQLSVGDVCLALTPVAASQLPHQPEEGRHKSVEEQEPPVGLGLEQPIGRQKRTTRRRHQSAP